MYIVISVLDVMVSFYRRKGRLLEKEREERERERKRERQRCPSIFCEPKPKRETERDQERKEERQSKMSQHFLRAKTNTD